MGYELKLVFHPRKETGNGFDMETKKEELVKVGKPFDETSLERLAGVVMSQMARRDIFVLAEEMEITELVRNQISFKECRDGKGIVLKNKKFSFNEAAQMVAEDIGVPDVSPATTPQMYQFPVQMAVPVQNGQQLVQQPHHQHPHEALTVQRQANSIDDLYGNPSKPVPMQRTSARTRPVNTNKVLYKVYLDYDSPYRNQVSKLPAKLSYDKDYPVHEVIPSATGRLDMQKLAITDDTGKVVELDERFFTSVGVGLVEDYGGRFSGNNNRRSNVRKPKLAFEDEMFNDMPQNGGAIPSGLPVDDGTVPSDLLRMPNIRPGRQAV